MVDPYEADGVAAGVDQLIARNPHGRRPRGAAQTADAAAGAALPTVSVSAAMAKNHQGNGRPDDASVVPGRCRQRSTDRGSHRVTPLLLGTIPLSLEEV